MKALILALFAMITLPIQASAQEITNEPICFNIVNDSDQTIYGSVVTAYVTTPEGQKIHYDGTFRLAPKGTVDPKTGYGKDFTEFCTRGPFFPGRQLQITLRTLIPVFSCKSNIESGDIVVHVADVEKDGIMTKKYWATCY